jgi:hypothetical protein
MKALTALLSLIPVLASAAQVTYTSSPGVTTASIVVADTRKLKTSLADALAAYPGEECIAFQDTNAVPNCPGFAIANGWTYALATGFPQWPDPNDPRKTLRIDGLKTKDLVNFLSPGACTATGCPTVPPPVPMTITFVRPTVEFGMMFRASWEGVDVPFTGGFRFIANGVDLGNYPVGVTGVQSIGVQAPEGLKTLTIVPYEAVDPSVVAPTVIHRIYTK